MPSAETKQWYALRVRANAERAAAQALRNRGIEEFLPLYRTQRQWSDRAKTLDVPLFPGYLFCRVALRAGPRIIPAPGITGFVGFRQGPEPVPDSEIEAVARVLDTERRLVPGAILRQGQRIRLASGPLKGLEGVLIRIKDQDHLVINIHLLERSVAVTIDGDTVALQ